MKLTFFELSSYGNIHRREMDTTDKNYVCHDDKQITVRDTYHNLYGDVEEGEFKHFLNFEDARLERVKAYEREIARYQEELDVYKNSQDYDDYWKRLRVARSK